MQVIKCVDLLKIPLGQDLKQEVLINIIENPIRLVLDILPGLHSA